MIFSLACWFSGVLYALIGSSDCGMKDGVNGSNRGVCIDFEEEEERVGDTSE